MALLHFVDTSDANTFALSIAFGSVLILSSLLFFLFRKPAFPKNAPQQATSTWPIFGSLAFFSERYDFWREAVSQSKTGNFSFYAGLHPVVGLGNGADERKLFFEHRELDFGEGYATLLQGAPGVKNNSNPFSNDTTRDSGFGPYFTKRLTTMLKGPQLIRGLPQLLLDTRSNLDRLVAASKDGQTGTTDPFDSIYRMVFHVTMRTVACHEIANDPIQLEKCLGLFEKIESCTSSAAIMFPWLPTPAKFARTYAGVELYMMFKNLIDDRNSTGRREEDTLQYLIDQGDEIRDILTFVLGSLFAGQLNSGINAAYILCYLAASPEWTARVRAEVEGVANKYCPDKTVPLKEKLMRVPIESWEGDFPMIDYCLKDTIRLQMPGTAFRRNISGQDLPIGKSGEVIPSGAFVALSAGKIHLDPEVYTNVMEWDPSRYFPDRAEDKKKQYSWMGWGLARHPCLGMRFAKLENNLIVAMFLAYFEELQLCDGKGTPLSKVPDPNLNNHSARKPDQKLTLKYKLRQD